LRPIACRMHGRGLTRGRASRDRIRIEFSPTISNGPPPPLLD